MFYLFFNRRSILGTGPWEVPNFLFIEYYYTEYSVICITEYSVTEIYSEIQWNPEKFSNRHHDSNCNPVEIQLKSWFTPTGWNFVPSSELEAPNNKRVQKLNFIWKITVFNPPHKEFIIQIKDLFIQIKDLSLT